MIGAQMVMSDKWAGANLQWETERRADLIANVTTSYLALAGQRFEAVHFEAPEDWWQAAKQRWFPAWLERRFPVRLRTVDWTPKVVYPQLVLPNEERIELKFNA